MSACGGNDKADAEKTVRDFVIATDKRDADKFCDELITKEFLEQTTFQKGDRAREACKQQIKSLNRGDFKLVRIDRTTINGDNARVRATLEVQKQRQEQVFKLVKEDGDWRLAGAGG